MNKVCFVCNCYMSVRFGNTWGLTVQRGPWKPNAYDAGFTVTGQQHAGHGNFYSAERPNTNPATPYSIPTTKTKTVKYADGNYMPSTRPGRVQRTYYTHPRRRMAPRQVGLNTTMEDVSTQTADFLGGGMSVSPNQTNGSSTIGSNNVGNSMTLYYPSNSEIFLPPPIVPGDPNFAISPGMEATMSENSFNSSSGPMSMSELGPTVGLGMSVVETAVNTFEAGLFEDVSDPGDDPVDQMWMNGDRGTDQPYLGLISDMVQLYPNSIAAVDTMGGVELANGEQLDAEQAQGLATVVEYFMNYGGSYYPQETVEYLNQQLNDGGMDWVDTMLEQFSFGGAPPDVAPVGVTASADISAPSGQVGAGVEAGAVDAGVEEVDNSNDVYPSGPDLVTDPTNGQPKGLSLPFDAMLANATTLGIAPDNFARWLRTNRPEAFAQFMEKGGRGVPVLTAAEQKQGLEEAFLDTIDIGAQRIIDEQKAKEKLPELVMVGGPQGELFPKGWGPDQFKAACLAGTPYINAALFKWFHDWYETNERLDDFEELKTKYEEKVAATSVADAAKRQEDQKGTAKPAGDDTTWTKTAADSKDFIPPDQMGNAAI